ncbi:MAG: sigma-70 family RNA polymerase sigma factor [Verrucomicrobiales bacterium]|nr:sigma-70 family RNA polymerase sigma factor [Verrucomicrobiales bacterium]
MDDSRTEEYLRLLAANERAVVAYVYSLVPVRADAEEILQEARVVMWKKFESFQSGTNFAAWAKKIALGLILNYRRSNRRKRIVPTEDAFIEAVAAEIDRIDAEGDSRSEALEICVGKLPQAHREMVLWRYFEELEVAEIADRSKRTESAVYRMLSRIRKMLQECIESETTGGVRV